MSLARGIAPLFLFVGLQAAACGSAATIHTVPPDTRVRVLERDLAWIGDTIPIVRFNPPFIYGAWRLEMESCTGKHREGWPKFYLAPIAPLPKQRAAYYEEQSLSVVFALGKETQAAVVKHELGHFLLFPSLPPAPSDTGEIEAWAHPPEYYGPTGACASTINPQPR